MLKRQKSTHRRLVTTPGFREQSLNRFRPGLEVIRKQDRAPRALPDREAADDMENEMLVERTRGG